LKCGLAEPQKPGQNLKLEAEVEGSCVRKPCPLEATGGSCGSAQGCQNQRGEEREEKYTVAKQWQKEKGRFYKFLNFMTILQQWNVHSICCEVSTENMHWAY
jgi:hypothetical protein